MRKRKKISKAELVYSTTKPVYTKRELPSTGRLLVLVREDVNSELIERLFRRKGEFPTVMKPSHFIADFSKFDRRYLQNNDSSSDNELVGDGYLFEKDSGVLYINRTTENMVTDLRRQERRGHPVKEVFVHGGGGSIIAAFGTYRILKRLKVSVTVEDPTSAGCVYAMLPDAQVVGHWSVHGVSYHEDAPAAELRRQTLQYVDEVAALAPVGHLYVQWSKQMKHVVARSEELGCKPEMVYATFTPEYH